jgi:hypothetical protein
MSDQEQTVFVAQGQAEAEQVRAFLEAAGIPVVLRGESLTKTHGLTVSALARIEIIVAAADAERANELLAAVERGELQLVEDDDDNGT